MEKMKQESKVKKAAEDLAGCTHPAGLCDYFVCGSTDIAVPVWHVWKFARRASSAWGGSGGCPFVSRGSAGGVSA